MFEGNKGKGERIMKKLIRLIMMLAIVLPALSYGADRVEAKETETIPFNLHKIAYPEQGTSRDGQDASDGKSGLNGIAFDVYDVTEDFYRLLERSDDKTVRDVQAELQGMELSNRNPITQKITTTINEEEGIANFNLPRKSEGKDAVYLFRESTTSSDVNGKAIDMVVVLPGLDPLGEPLEEPIHLYPKYEFSEETLQVTNQKETTIGKKPDEAGQMTMETKKQQPTVGLLKNLPKTNDLKNYRLVIIGGCLGITLALIRAVRNRRRNHHFLK